MTAMWDDASMDDVIEVEIGERIAVVTLHRPAARNALDRRLRAAIPAVLGELDADPEVGAVVLTGADPAFCAGLDLKELGSSGLGGGVVGGSPLGDVSKPVIGAVNGPAITGGLELALQCDFLVASERATFADTHARVGVMPGWGLTVLLPQAIGIRRARQMSFTGNAVDAATALAWGLVNEVVPHGSLLDRARALALDVVSVPSDGLAGIREAYRVAAAPTDAPALAAEATYSTEWARRFDPARLAAERTTIQDRGRSQHG